ncbi:MAG: DUF222 domain-containing protein, partial [Robiginitomaculum sp.]|nr:DUF222 domain-containing protein [Robiginitomaculum sp.]
CYQDDDGMWIIKAKLPAEEGGLLVKVITELGEKISAETFSGSKKEAFDKELELEEVKLTFPQRRADALVTMAEHFLATLADNKDEAGEGGLTSLKGAERCQLVLHVHHGLANEPATLEEPSLGGEWLLPDAARRLACDASLLVVEQDSMGNVLDIGRKSRIIPVAMARALSIRDGGCCQFPGCCNTRYVEGHHIKHWADGGETKLDNLVTLCRYHHRELHRGKFFLAVKPLLKIQLSEEPVRFADRLCFSTMDRYFDAPFNRPPLRSKEDQVIARNPAKFTCACCRVDELEASLPRSVYAEIDATTAVTKWLGEGMDLGLAVEGLLVASGKVVNYRGI